ncbi:MAG TPA: hypothetical protein VMB34_33070 [Acetobacteraceae bacterium]|nr:hypothetical protein [Acetobacteraceae bacterium]
MPFDAPFILGPFAVDAMGRLSPCSGTALPGFLFRWRGRMIRAKFTQDGAGECRLLLNTTLGRVPSTAGTDNPRLRPDSFQALRALPRSLPGRWRVALLPDHRVRLDADAEIVPNTATELLVELTRFLLELAPYLDVLDEAGIAAAGEAGSVNT